MTTVFDAKQKAIQKLIAFIDIIIENNNHGILSNIHSWDEEILDKVVDKCADDDELAEEFSRKLKNCKSYDEVHQLMMNYVEVE